MAQERPERKGTQVVHVRENSDHELDALFQNALNPKDSPGAIPLRMRNLPASFFKPPEPQSHHTRDGSTDSTGYMNTPPPGLNAIHTRAHSSPATLQQTLSTVPSPPQHVRQLSCDLAEDQPLPPGWEMARTPQGQRYFLNHHIQTTTWQDPRKANFNLNNANINQTSPPPSHQSPNSSMQNLQNTPLPPGWEQATTPEGEVYFINHVERNTSWFDPRLPMHMQRLQMRSQPQPQQPQQQQQQQLQQMPPQSSPQSVQGQPPPMPSQNRNQQPVLTQNETAARLSALQKLKLEQQKLRKRAEELDRQELTLRGASVNQSVPTQIQTSEGQVIHENNTEMTSVADPFLGQTNSTDLHARQESNDSGLGGMGTGTNFLSRTPEEFLSNVNEMDTQDGGHGQGDFSNMGIGTIAGDGTEHANMDSDDLVSTFNEDDLLNDVEIVLSSNKMDNLLTWL